MSEQYKVNVQPVLNTEALYEQLNKQKFKINVEIDSTAIGAQLQSAVSSISNRVSAKVPIEMNTTKLEEGLTRISSDITAISTIGNTVRSVTKSLD